MRLTCFASGACAIWMVWGDIVELGWRSCRSFSSAGNDYAASKSRAAYSDELGTSASESPHRRLIICKEAAWRFRDSRPDWIIQGKTTLPSVKNLEAMSEGNWDREQLNSSSTWPSILCPRHGKQFLEPGIFRCLYKRPSRRFRLK